uniref:Uncharacterized protein n=1 Tax=Peronospora matthiolae TaxID=2874970 RepID=A0AAV1UQP8_9STRA
MWEPSTSSEDAATRFREGRDESAVISIMKRLASTNDVGLRYIEDRLQSILMIWWKSKQRTADYVFNFLKINKSISKAQEKATMVEKAVCLADDQAFVMWDAYVYFIDQHDPIKTISRILVPEHFGIEEWDKILAAARKSMGPSTRREIGWKAKPYEDLTSHRELARSAKKPRGAKRKG